MYTRTRFLLVYIIDESRVTRTLRTKERANHPHTEAENIVEFHLQMTTT